MEDWAADLGATYRKVEVSRANKGSEAETPEHRYWRRFKTTASHKAYSAVHCVTYNPAAPHDFAATNSTRVQIYGARGKVVKRTISRFKDVVYCASFRRDGKLLAASGEETDVKVFDATSGGMLRLLRGHTKAVHACGFTDDKLNVLSASDDATVKLWDVATGDATLTMSGHTDHVRSLAPSPASPEIWASGSYDHTVKLWDCRTGDSVVQVDHGQPVQATLILPGGGVLVTAGGNIMKVWDILAGGRLLQSVSNHSKPITCLAMDPEGGRVISGSLDHHLKVPPPPRNRTRP
jgi:U3 small nucleolar RNA-associated protein 15